MALRRDIIVGLDVGTTKICVLVAEVNAEGELRVIGIGNHPSRGLIKGEVVNVEQTVQSIEEAVTEAERISGTEIQSAFAGISGGHIQSFDNQSLLPVGHPRSGITERDILNVIEAARAVPLPEDREVIHIIPQEFAVDHQKGIIDPRRLLGSRLAVRVHIVTGAVSSVQNTIKCINEAGVEVEDIFLQPLAASLAVLHREEQKSGILLVDIGGGTTDYALFRNEVLLLTDVVSVGGDHVTNDISIGLNLLRQQAEEIKKRSGYALSSSIKEVEACTVPGASGRGAKEISRKKLCRIIELRMEELFYLIKNEIQERKIYAGLITGVALTGGGALLGGVDKLAEAVLGIPARRGRPWGISGMVEITDSPIYATPVGLVKYGWQYRTAHQQDVFSQKSGFYQGLIKLNKWIKNYY